MRDLVADAALVEGYHIDQIPALGILGGAPVLIQVFVISTCPCCPRDLLLAHKLAMASDLITADMVEATEFPHLTNMCHVYGVPRTVINDVIYIDGAGPKGALLPNLMTVPDMRAMGCLQVEWQVDTHAHTQAH